MRAFLFCLLFPVVAGAQVSTRWDELTAGDFVTALERAQNTCLLPIGILEKHGPHLPLGTDLLNVRWVALKATSQEYAIVFPEYYFGQIFEARHEPGTIAYSSKLQLDLLRETTSEMARNGCKKIIIVNGHGGNNSLLPYFAQSQLDSKKDFVVYIHNRGANPAGGPKPKTSPDSHAGESETSNTLVTHPDLVHIDRAGSESGADRNRLDLPRSVYTGIWWYAKFPDHYAGVGGAATKELGEFDMNSWVADLTNAIRAVKSDQVSQKLQDEFFGKTDVPTGTKQ